MRTQACDCGEKASSVACGASSARSQISPMTEANAMKRNILGAALAVAGLVLATSVGARAQNFPARPVTLIVPWPAGGSTDVGMRALAGGAEKPLGQPIVVENRPGAAGTIGPANM